MKNLILITIVTLMLWGLLLMHDWKTALLLMGIMGLNNLALNER